MLCSPGFALTAVLILALGIAANVIVFGVLQALVLRSLNVPHADRVMTLQPKEGGPFLIYPEVRDVRDGNSVFSAVAAFEVQDFGLEANGVTRSVWGIRSERAVVRSRRYQEWKQQATQIPRPSPATHPCLLSSLNKVPISDPQTRRLIPISTTSHLDILTASGTSLLAGRDVSSTDTAKTPAVAIVNQEFARRLFTPSTLSNAIFKNGDPLPVRRFCTPALDRWYVRPRLLYGQQAYARDEYTCRTRCAGEADSLGGARSHADAAGHRVCSWHCAGQGDEPATLSHRLPSLRARSICACLCGIYCCAHRITFGPRPVRRVLHADPATLLREQ